MMQFERDFPGELVGLNGRQTFSRVFLASPLLVWSASIVQLKDRHSSAAVDRRRKLASLPSADLSWPFSVCFVSIYSGSANGRYFIESVD